MRARLERWLLARWYGHAGVLWLLWPLSLLVRLAVAWRRARRERGAPELPVIVVGNITVGGSGKTPLVLWLVDVLRRRGVRVGVISRGYGGRGPFPLDVSADTSPSACGDEPALLARRAGVPVVVDPDRRRALARLQARGVELAIADDGLQHYRLPRTVEIAVIDARRGLGNGQLLPVGPLREPASRLRTVDFVVANGAGADRAASPAATPAWPMQFRATAVRAVRDPARRVGVEEFMAAHGRRVPALAGIGDPARFFATLQSLGFDVDAHPFPDHHAFTPADLAAIGRRPLLMTEKDAAKCAAFAGDDDWYLEIEACLPDDFLPALLDRLALTEKSR